MKERPSNPRSRTDDVTHLYDEAFAAFFPGLVPNILTGGALAGPVFRATKTRAFSTNAQSRFVSVVLYDVLGPPRLARHT